MATCYGNRRTDSEGSGALSGNVAGASARCPRIVQTRLRASAANKRVAVNAINAESAAGSKRVCVKRSLRFIDEFSVP